MSARPEKSGGEFRSKNQKSLVFQAFGDSEGEFYCVSQDDCWIGRMKADGLKLSY